MSMQPAHKIFGNRRVRHALLDIGIEFSFRKRLEQNFLAKPVQSQLLTQVSERMLFSNDLCETKRRDPQNFHLPRAACEMLHHVQRSTVAPMHILEQENKRTMFGEAVHE